MDTAARVEKFLGDIRRRNRREILVGIVMLPAFAFFAALAPLGSAMFYGHVLVLAAILLVIGMLKYVASPRGDLAAHPASDVDHWKAEMLRQARLLRRVPFWYLGPFLPGFALLFWPRNRELDARSAIAMAMVLLVCLAVICLNLKAAAGLAAEADSLGDRKPTGSSGGPS